jgi:hypothetical protein
MNTMIEESNDNDRTVNLWIGPAVSHMSMAID